jgi:hypothetical protein
MTAQADMLAASFNPVPAIVETLPVVAKVK